MSAPPPSPRLWREVLPDNAEITPEGIDALANTFLLTQGQIRTAAAQALRLAGGRECSRETLRAFHEALSAEYRAVLYGDTALCHRMKEIWSYLILHFDGGEKHYKRLTKAKSWAEFHLASEAVFAELPLLEDGRIQGLASYVN